MMEFLLILIVCIVSAAWWEALSRAKGELEGYSEGIKGAAVKLVFFAYSLIVAFLVSILL